MSEAKSVSMPHRLPKDMKEAIASSKKISDAWDKITDIAKNEWICWVTIVKKQETRDQHIQRMKAELSEGKKRPCCWPGCPHRNPKAAKYFGKKLN